MKQFFVIFFNFFLIINLFGQSFNQNYYKYKYLRNRLREDFEIIDSNNSLGSNIPACIRNFYGNQLAYGQNPMIESICPYMITLATEYSFNKKYNIDNSQTLKELRNLLLTIERLDVNAEMFFRAENANIFPQRQDFWQVIENYKNPILDLNGFFIRKDVIGDDSYYYIDNSKAIYNRNNEQLKYVEYNDFNCNKIDGFGKIETNNYTVISQDEVVWLYLGLAFVSKLVDDNKLFIDINNNQLTIREWSGKIALRLLHALYNETSGKWKIFNPITNEVIDDKHGGNTLFLSSGFQLACASILKNSGMNELIGDIFDLDGYLVFIDRYYLLFNSTTIIYNSFTDLSYLMPLVLKIVHGNSDLYFYYYLLDKFNEMYPNCNNIVCKSINNLIIQAKEIYLKQNVLDMSIYKMKIATKKFKMINFEFFPLFVAALHDVNLENKWENNNFISYNQYVDSLKFLLDIMPVCGSYSEKSSLSISDNYWFNGRLYKLNKFNFYNDKCDAISDGLRIYSNMDYLILFNLVYTLLFDIDFSKTKEITYNFSVRPTQIYADNIYYKKKLSSNTKVTFNAWDTIVLDVGFETNDNSYFNAKISQKPNCWTILNSNLICNKKSEIDSNIILFEDYYSLFSQKTIPNIIVSPNPCQEKITIISNECINYIKIIDIKGSVIIFKTINDNNISIDVLSLVNGEYVLVVNTNFGNFSKKIIKK